MFIPNGYHSARHAAAIIDLSARGRIVVTGEDRVSYLQGLLSNDIAALEPGHGCYAAYLTPQGRMLADSSVLNLRDALLLDVHSSITAMLVDRFRELVFMEKVTVEDRTTAWAAFGIHGPQSARIVSEVVKPTTGTGLTRIVTDELENLPEYRHMAGQHDGIPVVAVRSDEIGEVGFVVYTDTEGARALGEALALAGAETLDLETFDLLRLEAGRPVFPVDMNQETIPLEAGIENRAISQSKGCYVGQEVIVRILHRGQGRIARRLVGLSFEPNSATPAAGAVLTTPQESDGKPVGAITSAAHSPALERPIALGYIKRELAEVGTELVAVGAEHRSSGVVTSGSFLRLPRAG